MLKCDSKLQANWGCDFLGVKVASYSASAILWQWWLYYSNAAVTTSAYKFLIALTENFITFRNRKWERGACCFHDFQLRHYFIFKHFALNR